MKRDIELLAPGGDIDSIKAAIIAGADAIYFGLEKFNARNRAVNIIFEDLSGIINLAHKNMCKVFLTLNIIIIENEISSIISLLNRLVNLNLDGVIVQDLGLFYILSKYFKNINVHASTQCTTHNEGQIKFLHKTGAIRVNLSRELNINEIKTLSSIGHKYNILTEVFVHGSYCISFSGICYLSSVHGGKSGNRGRCSQHCRDRYLTTPEGKNFPLNLKDNSAYFNLRDLIDAGVDSLKIEGRVKKFHYVYTIVNSWKKQIRSLYDHDRLNGDNSDLYKVFNRDFSNSYLKGNIDKDMFIDNPRDNSIKYLSGMSNYSTDKAMEKYQIELYKEKEELITEVKNKIIQLSIDRTPLIINISGELSTPLKVSVKTPDISFTFSSENNLANTGEETLKSNIIKRLKPLNNTEYYIKHLDLKNIHSGLFISFKDLTSIRIKILSLLNGSKEIIFPIELPVLKKKTRLKIKPDLSVLISSKEDLHLCNETYADIFYQIPDCLKNEYSEFIDIFLNNKKLNPWFPSILIGEDYNAAVEFLTQLQPERIITNNTGIAYEAYKMGIPWIAGPYLNIVNSFSLLNIKENYNCHGSFISNEINKKQIKDIVNPDNLHLYYSIYHPVLLMTSRQCLHHQVIGCEKSIIDDACIRDCEKSSSIINLKGCSFLIKKKKGNYNCLYNDKNYLNTQIINDIPDMFSSFFIDIRDIETETKIDMDKSKLIKLFKDLLNGKTDPKNELKKNIYPTTDTQYKKGI